MQQYPTHRSTNATLLVAAIGLGALAAYALSSPRRRQALRAAGESALDAGSRFAAASADRLRHALPEAKQAMSGLTSTTRSASSRAASTAGEALNDAMERASEAIDEILSRVRKLAAQTTRQADEQMPDRQESAAERSDGHEHSSGRGAIMAAAILGSGFYALQRYARRDRVKRNW